MPDEAKMKKIAEMLAKKAKTQLGKVKKAAKTAEKEVEELEKNK